MSKRNERSELRVIMPRDLYREIQKLAKADERKPSEWARLQFKSIILAMKREGA